MVALGAALAAVGVAALLGVRPDLIFDGAAASLFAAALFAALVTCRSMVVHGAGCGAAAGSAGCSVVERLLVASPGIFMTIGLCATVVVSLDLRQANREIAAGAFDSEARQLAMHVKKLFSTYEHGLRSARGLFAAFEKVSRAEFSTFIAAQNLGKEFPGALGFGYIERVPRSGLQEFIAGCRLDEAPDYALRTEGNAPELYLIKFIEPLARNLPSLGYDIGSEALRRAAADKAARTGLATLSAPLTLVQDERQRRGFLYLLPYYQGTRTPPDEDSRRRALLGWVYTPLVLDDTLQEVMEIVDGRLDVEVFDGAEVGFQSLLFDADDHLQAQGGELDDERVYVETLYQARSHVHRESIQIGGRKMLLVLSTTDRFDAAQQRGAHWVILLGGLVISLLATGMAWSIVHSRARAWELADGMTRNLKASELEARTAQRSAEQAQGDLAAATLRLQNVLDSATEVSVIATDPHGLITLFSRGAEKMLGYPAEEMVGQRTPEMIHTPEEVALRAGELSILLDRPIHGFETLVATAKQHGTERREWTYVCQGGGQKTVELSVTAQRDPRGEIVGFLGTAIDITDRKQAELELFRYAQVMDEARARVEDQSTMLVRQAKELLAASARAEAATIAKSAFLANMSHEIRTPLTAILGYAELVRDDRHCGMEKRVEYINTICHAGQHLLTIINDVLDLSKIEAGKMTVEELDLDLPAMLRGITEMLHPRAAEKGIRLQVRLTTPVPRVVRGDPTRLRQILMNLAGNAIKFTESGGVTISASASARDAEPWLRIDIEDSGPGMATEQAQRLFQAFTQADSSVTRKHGGSGLGLTISRRLAEMMGGDVALVHTAPGQGSCFRLEIPLQVAEGALYTDRLEEAAEGQRPAAHLATAKLTGRLLLAEDGLDNQRLIALLLRKAGAEVDVAENGRIALDMLEEAAGGGQPYDLLLTDMQMPEMDGYTLARTLRERGVAMPIVALTAHAMADDRQKCLDAGCDDFATKPIDRALLFATIQRWLPATSSLQESPA